METLGEYLKTQREACNITLKEVSEVTKIRRAILEAIENDRHDLLPPKVFTQGFLKTYASYIGLDESEVVKRYHEDLERMEGKGDEGKSRVQKHPKKVSSPTRVLVLFTVFILALAVWFFLLPQEEKGIFVLKKSQQRSTAESIKLLPIIKPEISGKEGEEKVDRKERESDFSGKGADRSGVKEAKEVEAERMVLRVLSTEITWIKFQLDRGEPFEVLLRSGESFRVKADEKFNLRVGNAGGVKLFLNGKALGSPGKRGEVIDLTLPE